MNATIHQSRLEPPYASCCCHGTLPATCKAFCFSALHTDATGVIGRLNTLLSERPSSELAKKLARMAKDCTSLLKLEVMKSILSHATTREPLPDAAMCCSPSCLKRCDSGRGTSLVDSLNYQLAYIELSRADSDRRVGRLLHRISSEYQASGK